MFRRLGNALRRFMYGRYGSDQLNMTLLISSVAVSVINSILSAFLYESRVYATIVYPILYVIMMGLLALTIFRCLSRNIYKRQKENRRFLGFFSRLKDRQHRYFRCPSCKQQVRVPRGKGKLSIRCPKCGQKFVKKS